MALTILTADQKHIDQDWQSFLGDKAIGSTITPVVETASTDFEVTPSRFFGLKFTTQANAGRFKLLTPFTDSVKKDVVILALDPEAAWSGSLGDVLKAFVGKVQLGGTGIVAKILNALVTAAAGQVPMSLVNPADKTDTRNAMWCIPGQTRVVSTALCFSIDPGTVLDSVKTVIQDDLGISVGSLEPLTFHLQRTSYGTPGLDTKKQPIWAVASAYSVAIQITIGGFDFWFQQEPGNTSVILTQNKDDETDVWTKLKNLGTKKNAPPASSNSSPSGPDILSHIDLLSISAGRNLARHFWWDIKTVFQWDASGDGKNPVLIGLTYNSLAKSFVGELLTRDSFRFDKALPTYRASGDVAPRTLSVKDLPEVLLLSDVFPEAASLPSAVPNAISVARVAYTGDQTNSMFGLTATLVRVHPLGTGPPVPAPFTWDSITIYAQKTTTSLTPPATGKVSKFAFGAAATFSLRPRDVDKARYRPASLALSVDYDDGQWRVEGHLVDLQFGVLVGFMDNDPGVRNAALDVLGRLAIKQLDVLYTYKAGQPSSFLLAGTITLGALELRLFYQYVGANASAGKTAADMRRKPTDPEPIAVPAKGATWQLRAYLGSAGGKKATLGEIINSIAGKGDGTDVIPEFVKSIEITPAASGADSAVSLEVSKTDTGAVFTLSVDVLGIRFSYIQISAKGQTTRLLRLAVDKLPLIGSIPLISQLGQPFDEMMYLYVSGTKGLLQSEVDAINAALDPSEKLLFKRAVATPSSTAPVIEKGHHFVVINNGSVALDHVFEIGKSETQPATSTPPRPLLAGGAPAPETGEVVPTNAPSKGSLSKTLGPLQISALTLQYKDKVLWIHMDAVLTLGPISLGLMGFGIGFVTTGIQLTHLSKIVEQNRLRWELHGMSVGFDQPPILLAGVFIHEILPLDGGGSIESYQGGIGVGFPPYTFVGVGEYSVVTQKDGSSYKSVFVFAKLDGPLVTLEFATISGVRLGFGFNSAVRSPRIDELTDFPFIKSSDAPGAGNSPLAILKAMTPTWVTPKLDSYWLAAGMTISSFDIIAITAVAMFAFRDSGVVISLFADAVAQLPPDVPGPNGLILYVEIGMVAEMNLIDGYFRVEASLAPSSYLLVPQCHLRGGFALAYWFGSNPNAGDWVFSIGGYHRAFSPPSHYPVPKRLGISFVIGDNIQMIGESYFAITPKAAMTGALIHVSLSVGPVSAYLDASFDALINFHPFHYIVVFSVSVGVQCNIDVWFIHTHISVHIGADLHIEGPDFGGIAHVDFWFFGFDIEFGARLGKPPPLELLEFWKTTHQPGPATSGREDVDANPVRTLLIYDPDFIQDKSVAATQPAIAAAAFKFVLEEGNFPMPSRPPVPGTPATDTVPSTGAGALWHVRGGTFRFGITTEFALSAVSVVGADPDTSKTGTEAVFASPMHVTEPITSTLTISIARRMPGGSLSSPLTGFRDVVFTHKAVPSAMWAPYDSALDIIARGPRAGPPAALLDGSKDATRIQALGVSLSAPRSVLSKSFIPKFKASAAAKQPVLDLSSGTGEDWYIPQIEPVQSRFLSSALTAEETAMDAPARWEEVKGQWSGFGSAGAVVLGDAVDGVLATAAGVFGWEKNRPVGEEVPVTAAEAPWLLTGKMPKKLVKGLTEFYLDLPRICV